MATRPTHTIITFVDRRRRNRCRHRPHCAARSLADRHRSHKQRARGRRRCGQFLVAAAVAVASWLVVGGGNYEAVWQTRASKLAAGDLAANAARRRRRFQSASGGGGSDSGRQSDPQRARSPLAKASRRTANVDCKIEEKTRKQNGR